MNVIPPALSLFARLRVDTREAHERTEKSLKLFREDFSRDDYFNLLNSFREFYRPYEKQLISLSGLIPASFELHLRLKLPLLEDDLQNFHSPDNSDSSSVRATPDIPDMLNIFETLGAMYVMEGSTLGGQMIYRHLHKTLKLDLNESSFFRGYNESTAAMWSKFKMEAEKLVAPENFEEIILSAQKTFSSLANWLSIRSV